MPYDRTDWISGYGTFGIIFGQLYHTPISQMHFWACGLADGDQLDLSDWFQEVLTVHATFNAEDLINVAGGNAINVVISGANNNIIRPFKTSGYTVDYLVIGHKAEGGAGFE